LITFINEHLGYIAGFLTTVSFLPQALKTLKTRCTKGISISMYALFVMGVLIWTIYGFLHDNKAIFIANSVTFIFSLPILLIALKNLKNAKG
jgi:MtN3 and saliva related transmembrane protein